MTLTADDYTLLKRPFTKDAVKFRIDGRPENGKVRILTYIDSRLAAERLTEVDPGWSGEPTVLGHPASLEDALKNGLPVVYHLTVKGVNRSDVGQIAPAKWGDNKGSFEADDKHAKMAVSDAVKRSAVLFGVGAYLYTLGNVTVRVKDHTVDGKGKTLNKAGQAYLKEQYEKFISKPAFVERFGLPIAYGEELAAEDSASDEPETAAASEEKDADSGTEAHTADASPPAKSSKKPAKEAEKAPEPSAGGDPHVEVIVGLFELVGRSAEAGREWAGARKNKNLAVKKTLRQAIEKGADKDKLKTLLETNGLLEKYGEALA